MTSIVRINHFVSRANEAVAADVPRRLQASASTLQVESLPLTGTLTREIKEQNRETWKIFKQSLFETIGERKFDWICHRYRGKYDFTALQKSGQPLLPEHVELMSIGASQLLGRDVKSRFPEKLRTLSREMLSERMRQVQPFPIVGSYKDPLKIGGSPGSRMAHFFHDKILMDKEKQLLLSDVKRQDFPAWRERFSKTVVNRELLPGQLIPAPGWDGAMDYYKVFKKIGTGDGLVAYALKPATADSTLKPLVVFRPSQWAFSNEDAFETYFNDVQPHIGEMGWKAAEGIFQQLMNDPQFRRNNEKISLSGYSLGGAHAQYFLAAHSDHIADAVFFSDPSVDAVTADNFAAAMREKPLRDEPLNIQIVRMKGDFCQYVGDKHVGWGVDRPDVNIQLMEIDHEDKTVAAFKLHSHRIFDNSSFPYQMQVHEDTQVLFEHLDNSLRGPAVVWYEQMRQIWGRVAYISLFSFKELVTWVSWVLGVKILRSSRDLETV